MIATLLAAALLIWWVGIVPLMLISLGITALCGAGAMLIDLVKWMNSK